MYLINGIGKVRIQLMIYVLFAIISIPVLNWSCKEWGVIGLLVTPTIVFLVQAIFCKIQLKKILPLLKENATFSIDTRSSIVAEECLKAGANIINDVSGFDYDHKMADVIAIYNIPIIIQHSKGTPENMQDSPQYNDLMEDIYLNLKQKIELAHSKGIENIIIDPGIGFGKSKEDNFEIIKRIDEFQSLNCPIMLGISRKSLLGMQNETNDIKDIYTLAINSIAIEHRVDYLRVHNVLLHRKLITLLENFKK